MAALKISISPSPTMKPVTTIGAIAYHDFFNLEARNFCAMMEPVSWAIVSAIGDWFAMPLRLTPIQLPVMKDIKRNGARIARPAVYMAPPKMNPRIIHTGWNKYPTRSISGF